MTEHGAVEGIKMLIEALHFVEPFSLSDQSLGANHENGLYVHSCAQLLDDEARFNRFAYTHFVSNQQARSVSSYEF